MTSTRFAMRGGDEFVQDAAFTGSMAFAAASAQGKQLLLQRAHAVQAGLDAFELGVDQSVDSAGDPSGIQSFDPTLVQISNA